MHELPNYFLDYRERSSDSARWGDRVCSSDPTWSGNIIDFFYRIYDKVTSGVKTPFALDENDRRIDETDVHEAVREVVANALIHADYHGRQGIVVEKRFNEIQVSNPGTMRISKEIAIEGGRSDPRNAQVFNIFSLIGIGERSGTGLSNLYALWEQHGFSTPLIREEFDPEKTIVSISTGLDNKSDNKLDNKSDLMSSLDNNSHVPQVGPSSAQDRPKVAQAPTKTRPRPDQDPTQVPQGCPKSDPRVTQGDPRVTQDDPSLMQDLPAAAKQVFRELVQDPKMTLRGLATKLGFSKTTVTTAIGILVANQIIRREGNKQTGHWEVVK